MHRQTPPSPTVGGTVGILLALVAPSCSLAMAWNAARGCGPAGGRGGGCLEGLVFELGEVATAGTDFDVVHFIHSCGAQGCVEEGGWSALASVLPVLAAHWQWLESSLLALITEAAPAALCQCSTTIGTGNRGGRQDEGGVVGQVGRSLHAILLPAGGLCSRLSGTQWSN